MRHEPSWQARPWRARWMAAAAALVAATGLASTASSEGPEDDADAPEPAAPPVELAPASPAAATGPSSAAAAFARCREQEKYGNACACYQLFASKHADAPPGEAAMAELKLAACNAPPAAPPTAPPTGPAFPARTADDAACYVGVDTSGSALEILSGLTARCVAPGGMVKMTAVVQGTQRTEDPQERYAVRLTEGECYRFFAIGDDGIDNLVAAIVDPDGTVVARDGDRDRLKILPPKDAYCPDSSGVHRIVVSVAEGGGRYVLQGYRRPAASPPPVAPVD